MSEHDHLKKQSWFTEKAPGQREQKENLFGDAHVGARTRTQDMVNPNVPVAESAFVKLARAKKAEQQESAGSAVEHVQRAATDSGSPLPDEVRGKFEASLGADLSGVRVHTGAASATAAESVGAKAYTTGQDIHFGSGEYDPSSKEGRRLLGHEVAHTVQQGSAGPTQPQAKLQVSEPADAHEQEADSAAEQMVTGAPASVSPIGAAGHHAAPLQRKAGTTQQPKPSTRAQARMAAPDEVQLGDLEVDDNKHESVFVFNQADTTAALTAHMEGPPALAIVSKPERVRPTREGFDSSAGIELSYRPVASAVDDGVLVVTLTWHDGASETKRIKIRAAAHERKEPTHAERAAEAAHAKRDAEAKEQQDKIGAAHEKKVQEAERRQGGYQPQIQDAYDKLENAADHFFRNQAVGADAAQQLALQYSKRPPPPKDPSVAVQLIKVALSLATGRLSSLVELGVDALKPSETYKHRERESTVTVPSTVLGVFKNAVGLAITSGQKAIEGQLSEEPFTEKADHKGTIEFFSRQQQALSASVEERKNQLVDIRRALLPLNTPELAGTAATLLTGLRSIFTMKAGQATEIQKYESTRQWARYVSHQDLGSVTARDAEQQDLRSMKDGSPTAKMSGALIDTATHDGVIDIEFSGDILSPKKPITLTKARLFGLSKAQVEVLGFGRQPLHMVALPLRLRSSAASAPLAVTITRDEAGNIAFRDDSGAIGMQTAWLSRRGGGNNDAAAYRAAKAMMDELVSKTTTQLGVELETDDA